MTRDFPCHGALELKHESEDFQSYALLTNKITFSPTVQMAQVPNCPWRHSTLSSTAVGLHALHIQDHRTAFRLACCKRGWGSWRRKQTNATRSTEEFRLHDLLACKMRQKQHLKYLPIGKYSRYSELNCIFSET